MISLNRFELVMLICTVAFISVTGWFHEHFPPVVNSLFQCFSFFCGFMLGTASRLRKCSEEMTELRKINESRIEEIERSRK